MPPLVMPVLTVWCFCSTAGEYDDTVGEVDLMRSGSEPDSDASEHRSSDTSVGLGEPLDPSSQVLTLAPVIEL